MKKRCLLPTNKNYQRYGGRGITFDPSWSNYDNFLRDMGPRPQGTSLDRTDPDGDYVPCNCRWATPPEQARNKSDNVNITWRGETLCHSDWAARLGISVPTLQHRFLRGWSVERAFTTPVGERWTRYSGN